MKKETRSLPLLGGSSLLTIFACLCLTVFSLLSITSVTARQRLSERSLDGVTAYYEADARAEVIFARLRAGELPQEVEQEADLYCYQCPIGENRSLFVELKKTETGWQVLRWQEVTQPLELDTTMPVWQGK